MLMQDINNMPLFWGEYQISLSSGKNNDNKSDIIDSTFKNCEHKQYISSEVSKFSMNKNNSFLKLVLRETVKFIHQKENINKTQTGPFESKYKTMGKPIQV